MKKIFALILILIFSSIATVQAERDENFRKKYKLESVLVFSRHNIRSPTKSRSEMLTSLTPHKWFKWTSNFSELSLRGGECETIMGQYFRQWLTAENLIPNNYIPAEGEVRFYANARERTFATAKFFSSGMMPVANVDVERKVPIEKNDYVFVPLLTIYNKDFDELARGQITRALSKVNFAEDAKLINKVIDFKNSSYAKENGLTELNPSDMNIVLKLNDEPENKGKQADMLVCAADALIMQYYEAETPEKAAFGHKISFEDWKKIGSMKDDYTHAFLSTPAVAINVAHPILKVMDEELSLPNRKFAFLCGHHSTIDAILGALEVEDYNLPKTIETKTPIGSKIVICKWRGEDGELYASMDLIYATSDQLRNKTTLTLDDPPVIFPLKLKNVQQNSDGVYKFEYFQQTLKGAIDGYENLTEEKIEFYKNLAEEKKAA